MSRLPPVPEVAQTLGWTEAKVRLVARLPLTVAERTEARRYLELARRVSQEPLDCPLWVLESAADALCWQAIRVERAGRGLRTT